jgi:ribosomal protein L11 methyltransferase
MTTDHYLKFTFAPLSPEQQELLLAELADTAFEGFEQAEDALMAYVPEKLCDDALRVAIEQLKNDFQLSKIEQERLAPQNWNEDWESSYEAVVVDDFCAIRADFHDPIPNVEHEVVITPKMSFGTGHHATTYMMLQAMRSVDFKAKRVLDYGCGTAVLAIVASYLGANDIVAVDYDYWAYENSIENVAQNTDASLFLILEGDWSVVPLTQPYDIILANINRNVILNSMADMAACLADGGDLLCSGFLEEDIPLVIEAAEKAGLKLLKRLEREKWRCICFVKA